MEAKIYQPAKTAMQSGRANTKRWVVEYEPEEAKKADEAKEVEEAKKAEEAEKADVARKAEEAKKPPTNIEDFMWYLQWIRHVLLAHVKLMLIL